MRPRPAALLLLLVVLAGCGLPLSRGVQEPGALPNAQSRGGGDIQVLPPGPRDDASPDEIVRNFFGAQSDPADHHASAREFLAPELRSTWRDTGPVSVFGTELLVGRVGGSPDLYRVTGPLVGRIGTDGAYTPADGTIDVQVQVRKGARGRPVITRVPDGLLLSTADRDRSFRVRSVYFLVPPATRSDAPDHVVPDQVFLPVQDDSAEALVRRLLAGPSAALGDSAVTSFPAGTTIRSVRADPAGLVTVDLSAQVGRASAARREQMSAQLVWTLIGSAEGLSSELRLLSAGRPVGVGTSGSPNDVQDRADRASYDPDGLTPRSRLYYIGGRRLRVLDPTSGPTADAASLEVVDVAAASPRGGGLALVSRGRGGATLTTGPTSGPFELRARSAALSSPSWGSGERGVWYLDRSRVMLAPPSGRPLPIPVDGPAGNARISSLRVSRDGARVALIAGDRLLIGRIADRPAGPRIVGLHDVAPGVAGVRDLSWDSATAVVVLGRVSTVAALVRVAVDGSSVTLINKVGLDQSTPLTLAAAPDRPLVVGARYQGSAVLFRDNGAIYSLEPGIVGGSPFYPG
ncbi:MAG: MtrAB system accessory lipoprotein LpqB [Mycobacteriales bacterium]